MTKSPEFLIKEGKFAKVPIIIGNEEDEGTLWSLMQPNITTTDQVAEYLLEKFFWQNADIQDTQELVATYQTITEDGSPYRTGLLNNWYPQFKRLAAILGDLAFTLSRRYFLEERKKVAPELKAWSYRSSYFYGVPILGSVHGGDIFKIVWGVPYDYATRTMRGYYYSFIYQLDPNWNNNSPNWPTWESSNLLMNLFTASQTLIPDDFRWDSYDWIRNHVPELTM
jgi:carboxylesterase type B